MMGMGGQRLDSLASHKLIGRAGPMKSIASTCLARIGE
jgi:hypothetical protein